MTNPEPDTTAYEIEVAQSRRRIAATVGAIQHRLDPRVIANEVMDAAVERGRGAVKNARQAVRDHSAELSVAGVAVGAALGAFTLTNSRKSRQMTQYDDETYTGDQAGRGRLAGVKDSASRVRDRAAEKAAAARDYTTERVSAARERTAETWQSTRDRAAIYNERAREQALRARDRTAEGVDHNPLTAILVGVAAGAIIGALLPGSRRENAALGRASDRVKQTAREAARAARDAGKARYEELGVADHAKAQFRELSKEAAEVAKSAGEAATKGVRANGNGDGRTDI